MVDDGLVDVSYGADGVFIDKDGKVARQVTKYLSGGVGLVINLDGRLGGVRHAGRSVTDEWMVVFRFALGFLYDRGSTSGFFQ